MKTMDTLDEDPMENMMNHMDLADLAGLQWTWQVWTHVINSWAARWRPHFGLWGSAGAPVATKALRPRHHGDYLGELLGHVGPKEMFMESGTNGTCLLSDFLELTLPIQQPLLRKQNAERQIIV